MKKTNKKDLKEELQFSVPQKNTSIPQNKNTADPFGIMDLSKGTVTYRGFTAVFSDIGLIDLETSENSEVIETREDYERFIKKVNSIIKSSGEVQ